MQIGLSVLSGFLFGFVWVAFLLRAVKELTAKTRVVLPYLLACFVPLAQIWVLLKLRRALLDRAAEKGVTLRISAPLLVITALVFPLLPLNVIALSLLQHAVNRLYHSEAV